MAAWAETQRTYASGHLQLFVESNSPVWVYTAWTAFLFAPFGPLPYPAGPRALHLPTPAVGLAGGGLRSRSVGPAVETPAGARRRRF